MASVAKNHHRINTATRLVREIVFSEEFNVLWKELTSLYTRYQVDNPEQEAFCDAFYCCYSLADTWEQKTATKARA